MAEASQFFTISSRNSFVSASKFPYYFPQKYCSLIQNSFKFYFVQRKERQEESVTECRFYTEFLH